jgi:enoyl-CoA hydratase/carnithine racemase
MHTLTVPHRLNPETLSEMSAQLAHVDAPTPFLLLSGESGRFCEGMDIGWIAQGETAKIEVSLGQFTALLQSIATVDAITVAVVDGAAIGGGLGFLGVCDHVIATPSSRFSLPEGRLGLVPGIILPYLERRLRASDIRRMIYTGRAYSAEEALAIGLIDAMVPEGLGMASAAQASIEDMRGCRPGVARKVRALMALDGLNEQERSLAGARMLVQALTDPEVKERLETIAAYLDQPT